jgi:hypothetical protein
MVFRALGARGSRSYVAADQESEFVKDLPLLLPRRRSSKGPDLDIAGFVGKIRR